MDEMQTIIDGYLQNMSWVERDRALREALQAVTDQRYPNGPGGQPRQNLVTSPLLDALPDTYSLDEQEAALNAAVSRNEENRPDRQSEGGQGTEG